MKMRIFSFFPFCWRFPFFSYADEGIPGNSNLFCNIKIGKKEVKCAVGFHLYFSNSTTLYLISLYAIVLFDKNDNIILFASLLEIANPKRSICTYISNVFIHLESNLHRNQTVHDAGLLWMFGYCGYASSGFLNSIHECNTFRLIVSHVSE